MGLLHAARVPVVGRRSQYSDPLRKLDVGAQVVAYQKGRGYVGYGVVTSKAAPIHTFSLENGKTLEQELEIVGKNDALPPDKWEYAVGISWNKAVPLEKARRFPGAFANQNVVCRLRDETTVTFLQAEFDIPVA